jgi:hypothetical protein
MNHLKTFMFALLVVVFTVSCELPTPPQELSSPDFTALDSQRSGSHEVAGGKKTAFSDDLELPDEDDLDILAKFTRGHSQGSPLVNESIGPEGGSVSLGDFEIIVPPGAVPNYTLFQIRRPRDPKTARRVVAGFRPHAREFLLPVTVRFPLVDTDLANDPEAAVVWWNGEDWIELVTTVIEGGRRLEAQTTHLSAWGISRDGMGSFAELSSGGE